MWVTARNAEGQPVPAEVFKSGEAVRRTIVPTTLAGAIAMHYAYPLIDAFLISLHMAPTDADRASVMFIIAGVVIWVRAHFKVRRIELGPLVFDPAGIEGNGSMPHTTVTSIVSTQVDTQAPSGDTTLRGPTAP